MHYRILLIGLMFIASPSLADLAQVNTTSGSSSVQSLASRHGSSPKGLPGGGSTATLPQPQLSCRTVGKIRACNVVDASGRTCVAVMSDQGNIAIAC